MFKKLKAFSLAEVTIVIMVLGVLVVLVLTTGVDVGQIKDKKTEALSRDFYAAIENLYQKMLSHDTSVGTLVSLNGLGNGADASKDTEKLREYIKKYMEAEDIDCSNIKFTSETQMYNPEGLLCFINTQNIIAGVYFDRKCKLEYDVKEYLVKDNTETRHIKNACGHIVYGAKDMTGILGKDLFVIGFGKTRIK